MSRGGLLVLVLGARLISGKPESPTCATFTCDSGCAKCVGKVDNEDNTQTVTISVESCKHEDVSWFCCRNQGCVLNGCDQHDPPGAQYDNTVGNLKCEESIRGTYTLPSANTTLTLQVHDGVQSGNVDCGGPPGHPHCCGGGGGSCGTDSSVCNYVINLSPTSGACAAQTVPPTDPPTVPPTDCDLIMQTSTFLPGSKERAFLDQCECSNFSCDSPSPPWSTKNYRFCSECPEFLNGAYHFSCPHCATADTALNFTCPDNWEACDTFVQVHSNCGTAGTDGGLAYNLGSDGWTAGSCGPRFCLSLNDTCQLPQNNAVVQFMDTNIRWKMVMFHKQIGGGDPIIIPALATTPTMYFTFFVKRGHFCSNDKNATECVEQPTVCKWDDQREDKCYPDICPPMPTLPPGPRPDCCDLAPGIETGDCNASDTAITKVCDFDLPNCSTGSPSVFISRPQ